MNSLGAFCIAVVVFGSACAGAAKPNTVVTSAACEAGDTLLVRTELFFGRNIPGGGQVSDSAWAEFVASFVTPRFPSGLTIIESAGQWRNAQGVIERERGKVLQIGGTNPGERRSATEIALEYKRRFRQEAVLRMSAPVCVRFYD